MLPLRIGQADHLFQRVVGRAGDGQHGVAGAEHTEQGDGDRVGAGNDAVAHQRVLRAHHLREHLVQRVPSPVAVAVAGGRDKMAFAHPVVDKGGKHLLLIVLGDRLDPGKSRGGGLYRAVGQREQAVVNFEKRGIHGTHGFHAFLMYNV